jgi:agmatine deiminase
VLQHAKGSSYRSVAAILAAVFIFASIPGILQAEEDTARQVEVRGLPIHLTDEELTRLNEIGLYHVSTEAPAVPIRQCAEWETVTGVLIRYDMGFGLPQEIIAEFAENITVHVLLEEDLESNAYRALDRAGVNMSNVEFIYTATNSIWTRDYGPQFIFASGLWGIVDHIYNRPRPDDDLVNWVLGTEWGCPVYGTDVIHSGGNYMNDGHGRGFSTDLVWTENSTLTHEEIAQMMEDYLGITDYVVIPDIAVDGIHHIDCWAKLLSEETILVKEVPADHPDYTALEDNVAYLQTLTNCYGRPYKIVRVFCDRFLQDDVAAYTNSIILNDKVFVPLFDIASDAAAMATYQEAMPGYEVLGYEYSWLTDDAVHCRAMGIHDRYMLVVDTNPLQDAEFNGEEYRISAFIDDRSESGLVADSLLVFWRVQGEMEFNSLQLLSTAYPDSYCTYVPGQADLVDVEYYIFAKDETGRRAKRPMTAPGALYTFNTGVGRATAATTPIMPVALEQNHPNPFNPSTTIRYYLPERDVVTLSVYDVLGREVCRLVNGQEVSAGMHTIQWTGRDASGNQVSSGVYFYRLQTSLASITRKMVLLR